MTTELNDDQDLFRTRSFDISVLLRFALGAERHIETIVEDDHRMVFVFSGMDECRALKNSYYEDEPMAVTDLKALNAARYELVALVRGLKVERARSLIRPIEPEEEVTE